MNILKLIKNFRLERISDTFDFIFVDADKKNYIPYYQTILAKNLLRKQGLLVVDNTLFRGEVVESITDQSKKNTAKSIHEFNKLISNDNRVEKIILPIRDGLTLIRFVDS